MDIFQHLRDKRWLVIFTVILACALLAGCGLGPQFTYQGVLLDAGGNPYNGSVTITYRIFDDDDAGTELYSQSEAVTVTEGRFDSVVGPDSAMTGLDAEDLSQPLWVELQIDNGTYAETLKPRQQLYGAPYAFTLMPGAVISSGMAEELHGTYDIKAVTTVKNAHVSDSSYTALPALRVVGDKGIELVDISGSHGTIYSELSAESSDLRFLSNDDIWFYLNNDESVETSYFYVYGDPTTNYCRISYGGNLYCTGTVSWISPMTNGETRSFYGLQSTEVEIEDFGSAQLSAGEANVQIDSTFAETVNLDVDYQVFLTPLGDCNGLYVTDKTATGFVVRELGGGTTNIGFDYRIVAKRVGYEDQRMEVVPASDNGMGK